LIFFVQQANEVRLLLGCAEGVIPRPIRGFLATRREALKKSPNRLWYFFENTCLLSSAFTANRQAIYRVAIGGDKFQLTFC